MKTVSIIITAYNAGKTIARCLDSVLEQCFTDYEIILIDDASTDKTHEIAESYNLKTDCIRIVTHKKNKGTGISKNNGIKHSNSPYILFLDSDDTLVENSLIDIMQQTIESNADLVVLNYNFVNPDGTLIKKTNFNININPDPLNFISDLLKVGSFGSGMANNKLLKSSVIRENGIKFPSKVYYEDMPFVFHYILFSTKIQILDNTLFNYTQRKDSISNHISIKNIHDNQEIIKQIKRGLIKHKVFKNLRNQWDYFYIRRNCNYLLPKILDTQKENHLSNQLLHEHLHAIDQKIICNNIEKLNNDYLVYLGDYFNGNPPFQKKKKFKVSVGEGKNLPLVSYIMPVWNREKYLALAIQSVLIQTYKNIELLIIDDGSTDRSPEIIAEYAKKDNRIRTFINPINIGNTPSRNILIRESKGEMIAFIDSDDLLHPEKTEIQVKFLSKHTNYGAVGSYAIHFSESSKTILKKPQTHKDIFTGCFYSIPVTGGTLMIRRSAIEKDKPFIDEKCKVVWDYYISMQLVKTTRIFNLSKPLYYYRIHDESISITKKELQIQTVFSLRKDMLDFVAGKGITEKEVRIFKRYLTNSSDFKGNLTILFDLLLNIKLNISKNLTDFQYLANTIESKLITVIYLNRKIINNNKKLKRKALSIRLNPIHKKMVRFYLKG